MADSRSEIMLKLTPVAAGIILAGAAVFPAAAQQTVVIGDTSRELLSTSLYPLSTYYGVCLRDAGIIRGALRNGMRGYPTVGELLAYGAELKIAVGKFGTEPNSTSERIASSPGRAVHVIQTEGRRSLLVSDFDDSGNMVSVEFESADPKGYGAALSLANNVVACSLVPASIEAGLQ